MKYATIVIALMSVSMNAQTKSPACPQCPDKWLTKDASWRYVTTNKEVDTVVLTPACIAADVYSFTPHSPKDAKALENVAIETQCIEGKLKLTVYQNPAIAGRNLDIESYPVAVTQRFDWWSNDPRASDGRAKSRAPQPDDMHYISNAEWEQLSAAITTLVELDRIQEDQIIKLTGALEALAKRKP